MLNTKNLEPWTLILGVLAINFSACQKGRSTKAPSFEASAESPVLEASAPFDESLKLAAELGGVVYGPPAPVVGGDLSVFNITARKDSTSNGLQHIHVRTDHSNAAEYVQLTVCPDPEDSNVTPTTQPDCKPSIGDERHDTGGRFTLSQRPAGAKIIFSARACVGPQSAADSSQPCGQWTHSAPMSLTFENPQSASELQQWIQEQKDAITDMVPATCNVRF